LIFIFINMKDPQLKLHFPFEKCVFVLRSLNLCFAIARIPKQKCILKMKNAIIAGDPAGLYL